MTQRTKEAYDLAFETERKKEYPAVDAYERRLGFAINRGKLEDAARVLACPIKVNPPNWQHGRIVYATARKRLADLKDVATLLDIGTAKGFSAICANWALQDSGVLGRVHSTDVIHPESTEPRNSVADLDGPQALSEIVAPWLDNDRHIFFDGLSGVDWLKQHARYRIHFAFIDGKHSYEAVSAECGLLTGAQSAGDVIVLDDLQIPGIARAMSELTATGRYEAQTIIALPNRAYGVAWRTR